MALYNFKPGDIVRQIKYLSYSENPLAVVTRVNEYTIWHIHLDKEVETNASWDCFELVTPNADNSFLVLDKCKSLF